MPPVPALSNQFQQAKGRALVQVRQRLVTVAKSRHAAVMGRQPRPTGFLRIVDGRMGAAEEAVKLGGIIIYLYERAELGFEKYLEHTRARLDDIARFTLETLRTISPVGQGSDPHPGLYRDSHALFLNGYPAADLSRWNPGDEISISNFVEYSRILEVGDGRFRLPMKVYERAHDIVQEKYGAIAKIEFTFRGIVASMQIPQSAGDRRGFGVRRAAASRQHNVSNKRFPTIVLKAFAEPQLKNVQRIGQAVEFAGNLLSVAQTIQQISYAGRSQPQQPLQLTKQGITIDG